MANKYIDLANGWKMQVGNAAFVTSGTTVTVATQLKNILACVLTENAAYANTDLVYGSKTVSSGAITVTRGAGTTSALGFDYILIGY